MFAVTLTITVLIFMSFYCIVSNKIKGKLSQFMGSLTHSSSVCVCVCVGVSVVAADGLISASCC